MRALRKIRKAAGITQQQLADQVGLTPAAIGHYETGRRQLGLADARRLVAALNALGATCTLEDAFPEDEDSRLAA